VSGGREFGSLLGVSREPLSVVDRRIVAGVSSVRLFRKTTGLRPYDMLLGMLRLERSMSVRRFRGGLRSIRS
jgi:hypothetical protein